MFFIILSAHAISLLVTKLVKCPFSCVLQIVSAPYHVRLSSSGNTNLYTLLLCSKTVVKQIRNKNKCTVIRLERISIECRKARTKVITLTNHKGHRQSREPIRTLAKLQRLQNAAARLVSLTTRFSHITPALADLHWLPVRFRIRFKILIFVFRAIHGLAPSYLSDLITIRKQSSYNLRSNNKLLLRK